MAQSAIIKAAVREKVGSRDARKLRGTGRVPGSLQADGNDPHVNIHFDVVEFQTLRRHHTHLYTIEIEGKANSALVRELQWDAFGDQLQHVEFKRVRLDVATETEVELEFVGTPKEGVLNHLVTQVTVRTLPGNIPDSIIVKVGELEIGQHIQAGELELPPGVELAVPADLEVVVLSAPRAEVEETPEEDEAPAEPTEDAGPEDEDAKKED